MVKWAHESISLSNCFKITWNSTEQPIELTQKLATDKVAPHSWCSFVLSIVGHYYVVIFEGL